MSTDLQTLTPIRALARESSLDAHTLGAFIASPDVSGMNTMQRAEIVTLLHRKYGLDEFSRAFIIFDKKIYATAAAVSAVKRREKLGVYLSEPDVIEIAGISLLRSVAECGPADAMIARAKARRRGEDDLPFGEQIEKCTTLLPLLVERVTEWGENSSGKRYPRKKEWRPRDPLELANEIMKLETKSARRVVLKTTGMGSAAEEHPHYDPAAADELVPDIEQVIEAEVEERRPRKDAGLIRSNEQRRDLFAHLVGKTPREVWAGVLGRIEVGDYVEPHQLMIEDSKAARSLLKPAIVNILGEAGLEGLEAEAKAHELPVVAALRSKIESATGSAVPWTGLGDEQRQAVIAILEGRP
jgi:hypothetical protein